MIVKFVEQDGVFEVFAKNAVLSITEYIAFYGSRIFDRFPTIGLK